MSSERECPTVDYFANVPMEEIFQGKDLLRLYTNKAVYSPDIPVSAGASACVIVLIHGENNKWSMYHGAEIYRDNLRTAKGDVTLKEFAGEWLKLGVKATQAFLFAVGQYSSGGVDTAFRDEAVSVIGEATGLDANKLVVAWNDFEWGETEVLLDSETNSIKVIFEFCEEDK